MLDPTVVAGASGAILIEVKAEADPVTLTTTEDTSDPVVAVSVDVPILAPVNKPVVELIVPTTVFELVQVVVAANGFPN